MRDILGKFRRRTTKEEVPDKTPLEESEGSSPGTVSSEVNSEEAKPGDLSDGTSANDDENFANTPEITLGKGNEVNQIIDASIEETVVGKAPATIDAGQNIVAHQPMIPILKVGQSCHLGNVRDRNEDSVFVLNTFSGGEEPFVPFGLYIVADGMGGHHAGHKASKSAASIMARDVTEQILVPLIKNETGGITAAQHPIGEVMLGAIKTANEQIYNPDPEKEGGTTTTAALIIGRRLYIAHVGDSRAYILMDGGLKQVTTDHSYVRRLIEAGQITEEEAAIHPQRNMLYRAVGAGGALEVETFTQTLPDHGYMIICSDGLWGLVPESVIEDEIRENGSLQGAAESLVESALNVGGYDNISIIIVEFSY